MSKKYKPRQPTGREYVDCASKFCALTLLNCMKLPQRWQTTLLDPLIKTSQQIEATVVAANRIYINDKTMEPEALVKAYSERMEALQKALRLFSVFDVAFDRMMNFVDVSLAEKKRLKNIVLDIIRQAQEKDENLKELEIKVVSRGADMEYMSAGGTKKMRLKLTSKGKELWLAAERESERYIKQRLEMDKRAVAKLQKPA